jgi:hypothetical protein
MGIAATLIIAAIGLIKMRIWRRHRRAAALP